MSWQTPPSAIHRGWRYTIDLTAPRELYDAGEIDVAELGKRVATALAESLDFREIDDLIDRFRDTAGVDDFDDDLEELYNWADEARVIVRML